MKPELLLSMKIINYLSFVPSNYNKINILTLTRQKGMFRKKLCFDIFVKTKKNVV